ncbi:MAG: hypothetical protein RL670_392 [Actinomycetota bacterium]|jgi:hypothetical protein
MEIAIHQILDSPFVEVIDNDSARVHIPLGMGANEIAEKLGGQLAEPQLQAVSRLLSDDSTDRHFENHPDFLLIRFAG